MHFFLVLFKYLQNILLTYKALNIYYLALYSKILIGPSVLDVQ